MLQKLAILSLGLRRVYADPKMNKLLQRQTAVTAYFSSKQLLLFVFVRQYFMRHDLRLWSKRCEMAHATV